MDDDGLVVRVRDALGRCGVQDATEVRMFGGISFMVDGRMIAAARRDGDLLLRIDPSARGDLLARPGAGPAMMGAQRPMGEGWLSVSGAALADPGSPHDVETPDAPDPRLDSWIAEALRFHAREGA